MSDEDQQVSIRIIVENPPPGAHFAVQRGKDGLLNPKTSNPKQLVFEFDIRVRHDQSDGPNFLGPYAQGPVGARFVYVNSGTMAGVLQSPWTRRAKIQLAGITWALTTQAMDRGEFLEARIAGTARDGGPACATVPLLNEHWQLST
ncbi:MAG: DUF5990 family protein [Thermoanaerobaculia bacterium]